MDAAPTALAEDTAQRRPSAPRAAKRRPMAAVLAGFAVVGFSAAIVAPAGIAMATPSETEAATQSMYSLAAQDAQNLTVTVQGAQATPIARDGFEVYVTPTPTPTPTPEPEPASDGGSADSGESGGESGGSSGPLYYEGGGDPAAWMAAAGIAAGDWGYVDYIVSHESGWNPNATNSSSGACGLVQALPCSKVDGNGYDPVDNLRWANGYAVGRYGSWAGAYDFWVNNSWW